MTRYSARVKDSSTCPKCSSRRQWILEPFRVPSEGVQGEDLRVVNDLPEASRRGMFRAAAPQGRFDLYVCADCGYSELWAKDLGGLRHAPEHGVRWRDQTDPNQGPFR